MEPIEKAVYQYLKLSGILFPETDEEMEEIEREIKEENFKLPERLNNPQAILACGYQTIIPQTAENTISEMDNAYSAAARGFKAIPDEVKVKMEEDRMHAQIKD